MRGIYDRYRPIWLVDVHNQNPAVVLDDVDPEVNRPGRQVTGSITANPPGGRAGSSSAVETAGNRDEAAPLQLGFMEITNYYHEHPTVMSAAEAAIRALPETPTACWEQSDWRLAKLAHWAAACSWKSVD